MKGCSLYVSVSNGWANTPLQNAMDTLVYKKHFPNPNPNFIHLNSPGGLTFHSGIYEVFFLYTNRARGADFGVGELMRTRNSE